MLKKLIAASLVTAFVSMTPAFAQTPAPATSGTMAPHHTMMKKTVVKKPMMKKTVVKKPMMKRRVVKKRMVRKHVVRHPMMKKKVVVTKPKGTM